MLACVFHGPGNLKVEERPIPEPGEGEVLIKTGAASLCFSDIRVFRGEKSARQGVIQGHEASGNVVSVGAGVRGIAVGERVAICPIMACGACYFCVRGLRNRCLSRKTLGYDADGGLAEYILAPRELVEMGHILKVPKDLPDEIACQTEPFACALYSLETCGVGAGGSLAIVGAGPMGLIHVLLAKAMGCKTIIVSDPVPERLTVAFGLGATFTNNPRRHSLAEDVLSLTDGLGTDAVIVSVGAVAAIDSGIRALRKQGTLNIFGGCPPGSMLSLDPNLVHYNELWITGTQNANPEHYQRALAMLPMLTQAPKLVTHRFPIADAPKAFDLRSSLDGLKAVIDFPT